MDSKVLSRENFSMFLNCFKLIQEYCNDAQLVNGKLRQKSNDKMCLFEIDMSKIFPEDLMFTSLKLKVMLLKAFELDTTLLPENADQNIVFQKDDKIYRFIDLYSDITLRIPLKKYLDNTYVEDDEWNKIVNFKEEDLILSTTISSYLGKRIKVITEGFENDVINLKFNEFKGTLCAETSNKDNTSDLVKNIELNCKMEPCQSRVISLPFSLDLNSNIIMDVYKTSKKVVFCRFKMKYFGVPITLYAASEIVLLK